MFLGSPPRACRGAESALPQSQDENGAQVHEKSCAGTRLEVGIYGCCCPACPIQAVSFCQPPKSNNLKESFVAMNRMESANASDPGGRIVGFSKQKYRMPWDIFILKNIYCLPEVQI